MNRLQDITLNALPVDELAEVCYGDLSSVGESFGDCWSIWRERAQKACGCPGEFFDLPLNFRNITIRPGLIYSGRDINGFQRYLEVTNYYQLDKEGRARLYENGKIEGVYEKVAGYIEGWARDDPNLEALYGPFSPEQENYIQTHLPPIAKDYRLPKATPGISKTAPEIFLALRSGSEGAFEYLTDLFLSGTTEIVTISNPRKVGRVISKQTGIVSFGNVYISEVLRSGQSSFFDVMIKELIPQLPEDFSVENIRSPAFGYISPNRINVLEQFPLIDLGYSLDPDRLSSFGLSVFDLFAAANYGGNLKVIDFFRYLFQAPALSHGAEELIQGYNFHKNPVAVYSILQRWAPHRLAELLTSPLISNVDFFMYLQAVDLRNHVRGVTNYINPYNSFPPDLSAIYGVIPALTFLLDLVQEIIPKSSDFYAYLLERVPQVFPLTREILEEKIVSS